jgi:lipopolysaccharide transport system permease protein
MNPTTTTTPMERKTGTPVLRLWKHREMLLTLVKRDLKVRYKTSTLGLFWSFGKPLFLMLVIAGVFSGLVKISSGHPLLPYQLHLLAGLLAWFYFAGTTSESLWCVVGNENMIKKIWLPSEVFPATVVLTQLAHFLLALLVLGIFILGFAVFWPIPEGHLGAGDAVGWAILPGWEILLLPLLILLQTLLVLGIALCLSSITVFLRDVGSITEILLSAWFYLTPIIYPANFAREQLAEKGLSFLYWIYLLNPMTPIIIGYRRILFGRLFSHAPEVSDSTLLLSLACSCVTTAFLLILGATLYKRLSPRFADEI